jgi:hypothetical protein
MMYLITFVIVCIVSTFALIMKQELPNGFDYLSEIDLSIILHPRYAISGNFAGEIIDEYLR